jgi:hypothetical protein
MLILRAVEYVNDNDDHAISDHAISDDDDDLYSQ